MEIKEILVLARQSVDEANIPEDLRQAAFEKAVDLLAGGQGGGAETAADSAGLGRLAAKIGRNVEEVEELFEQDDEGVQVIVAAGRLAGNTSAATRQLALLVTGVRQLTGEEDWTDADVIRAACEIYGKLDPPNFAKTLKGMSDVFGFKGTARKRQVKLNRVGWEQLGELVGEFTQRTT